MSQNSQDRGHFSCGSQSCKGKVFYDENAYYQHLCSKAGKPGHPFCYVLSEAILLSLAAFRLWGLVQMKEAIQRAEKTIQEKAHAAEEEDTTDSEDSTKTCHEVEREAFTKIQPPLNGCFFLNPKRKIHGRFKHNQAEGLCSLDFFGSHQEVQLSSILWVYSPNPGCFDVFFIWCFS